MCKTKEGYWEQGLGSEANLGSQTPRDCLFTMASLRRGQTPTEDGIYYCNDRL